MYYFTWTVGDDFNSIEIIGQKGESDKATRLRAAEKYKEIVSTPGVSNVQTYIQTIDIVFSTAKGAKEYTYFCDIDQVSFAKLCARTQMAPNAKSIIRPKRWTGIHYNDEHGNEKGYYFVRAKYRPAVQMAMKAKAICKRRGIEYTGNLLQVYAVFHA